MANENEMTPVYYIDRIRDDFGEWSRQPQESYPTTMAANQSALNMIRANIRRRNLDHYYKGRSSMYVSYAITDENGNDVFVEHTTVSIEQALDKAS